MFSHSNQAEKFFLVKPEPISFCFIFLKKGGCGQLSPTFFPSNVGQDILFHQILESRNFFQKYPPDYLMVAPLCSTPLSLKRREGCHTPTEH